MERVEKILLLAVLGVAVMIVAVMSFLPEEVKAKPQPVTSAKGATAGQETKQQTLRELMGHSAPGPRQPEFTKTDPGEQGGKGPSVLEPLTKKPDGPGPADAGLGAASAKGAGVPAEASAFTVGGPPARVAMQYSKNPEYLDYVVQGGDTLGQIVKDVCGTLSAVDAVLSVNEELKVNPHLIAPGYRLLIPKFAVRPLSERTKAVPKRSVAKEPAAKTSGARYTVKDGDNLWKIAVGIVGKRKAAAYVAKLQDLNPKARGTLRPGTELVLP
ncbi:MAG: LysM peptidoglycan-binding domain-containing protein [Planctomycetota bacterium]|jgi:nucleoid-associated protein YgaU|nr:LysM peptidoglycan-binding domain-containing protein [Planctomycetota bacterium]